MMKRNRRKIIKNGLVCLMSSAVLLSGIPAVTFAAPETVDTEAEGNTVSEAEPDNAVAVESESQTDEMEYTEEQALEQTAESGEDQGQSGEEESAGVEAQSAEEQSVQAYSVTDEPSVIAEEADAETGSFTVRIQSVTLDAGENVIVPIWSGDDQSDLVWYTAVQEGDDYVVHTDISAHEYNTGTYHIHVYRRSADWTMNFLVETDLQIDPSADSVTAESADNGTGILLTAAGVKTYGSARSVEFAVWSEENGQDDLHWYRAQKNASGNWSTTVPLSDHTGTGTYYIHTYVFTKAGRAVCLNQTEFEVEAPSCSSFSAEGSGSTFTITVSGITAPFTVSSLVIPVWSKADQSDLVWYTPEKEGDTYVVRSDISRHQNQVGTYQAHLYIKDSSGKMYCIGQTSFTTGYTYTDLSVSLNADQSVGTVSLSGLSEPSDIKEIVFAVWSEENGQDDLHWYHAKKSGGVWKYDINISAHSSEGKYFVHCYLDRKDGTGTYIGSTVFNVEKAAASSEITVSDIDTDAGTWQVNISVDPSLTDIRVAVWSRADQGNLSWYFAENLGDGKFRVLADISNHKNEYGTYQVHVYSYKEDQPTLLGTATAAILADNLITVTDVTEDQYTVVIRGANYDGEKAASVVCPTWSSEGGQDDLKWYEAVKQTDGSFKATVQRSNHAHDGLYITDVYVKNAAGSQKMVGRVSSVELTAAVREFDEEARAVMRNIIYAVETGGQIYGNCRYDCFTEAYTNSSGETAITIGAGAWFATEAKHLLSLIREQYPAVFEEYDTADIGTDLDNENWQYYGTDGEGTKTILKGSDKAVAIQNIISTPEGIAIQDSLIDEQMVKYADQAKELGVTDLKARLFCANIHHLGGYSAMVRIINYCKTDGDALTMENLWSNMREREAGSGNKVGSDLYATRHTKVMQWLNTYL